MLIIDKWVEASLWDFCCKYLDFNTQALVDFSRWLYEPLPFYAITISHCGWLFLNLISKLNLLTSKFHGLDYGRQANFALLLRGNLSIAIKFGMITLENLWCWKLFELPETQFPCLQMGYNVYLPGDTDMMGVAVFTQGPTCGSHIVSPIFLFFSPPSFLHDNLNGELTWKRWDDFSERKFIELGSIIC